MLTFLSKQFDYIFFIYGLTFILLSVPCFIMGRLKGYKLPWTWIGLFAASMGVSQWATVLSAIYADAPIVATTRALSSILAYVFLLQFGMLGTLKLRGRYSSKRSVELLLGVAVFALLATEWLGIREAIIITSILGGALTSAVLLLTSRRMGGFARRWLLVGGGTVIIYIVISSLALPAGPPFEPGSSYSAAQAFSLLSALVVCGVAIFLAAAGWAHSQASKDAGHLSGDRIAVNPVLGTAVIIIVLLTLGWIVTNVIGEYGDRQSRNFLLSKTLTAAAGIDANRVKSLTGTTSDFKNPDYNALRKFLQNIRQVNQDGRFVYLLGIRGDRTVFLVDAEPVSSKDFSPPGQVYDDATADLIKLFRGGGAFVEGPVIDDWGAWVSGLAPIKDTATGHTIAVLGIDIDANDWTKSTALYRLFGITVALTLCVLTLAFSMARQKTHESAMKIGALQVANEKKLRNITSTLGEGVFVVDKDGLLTFINPEAERLLAVGDESVIGKHLYEVVSCRTPSGVKFAGRACPIIGVIESGETWRIDDCIFDRMDGTAFPVSVVTTPIVEGGSVVGAVTAFHDITDRKKAEETIKRMAYYDALTYLPNRMLFNDRLKMALASADRHVEKLAVMFLDLDQFKSINDTLGHAVGDELLMRVAERLKGLVREGDTVARLGGDEFILLIPQVRSEADVTKIARKVLETLQPPFTVGEHILHATASIGIAIYPDNGKNSEALLKNADIAMYKAKEKGRATYQLYTPAMSTRALERLALETSLRRALENREFVLHYQPQVNVDTGQLVGVEALIRWSHPDLGMIYPGEFIEVAEETGLIVPIGDWVLRTACTQNKKWMDAGFPRLRMAVNLSATQFQQPQITNRIRDILKETQHDPELLELEITESITMKNVEATIRILRDLRAMGIRIAIDDFGTGYSSLNYLQRLPINTLKIAKPFVQDVAYNSESAAIATTVIVLARSLKLNVIAEGVETEEQLAFLKQRHCNEMQGYLVSKALPSSMMTELLAKTFLASPQSTTDEMAV